MNNTMASGKATLCDTINMPIPISERLGHTHACIDEINAILARLVNTTFGEDNPPCKTADITCMESAVRYIEDNVEAIGSTLKLFAERMGV